MPEDPSQPSNRQPRGAMDRRHFGRTLLVSAAALACPGAATALEAAESMALAPEIKKIKDRGQLIVGMTAFDSPPFYYLPKKPTNDASVALEGWDLQLATDLARALDVRLAINRQPPSFNTVVDLVTAGTVDVAISKLSVTPRRAVAVLFTQPTIELRHALMANRVALAKRATDSEIRSVFTRGYDGTIGVIAKSSYAEIAKQIFSQASLREYPSWEEVVDAVDRGNVDLAYRDELEVKRLMRLRPELHLTLRSVLITDLKDAIAAAVAPQSLQLLSVINVVLSQRKHFDANQLLDEYNDIFAANDECSPLSVLS